MERTRLPELDILRSMAFLGVVAQHVLGAWAGRTQGIFGRQVLLMVCFELVRFAVPMFVFLFAMMLAGYTDREFSYGSYLGKRVRQILCPYAVWTAIFLQYFGRFSFPKEYLRSLVLGDAMYHMWYVPMIFQFVILAPLFIWLFRRFQKRQRPRISWLCLLLLSLAWLALVTFFSGRSGAAASLISRYPNKCFAGWMVYFCAGAFCGCNYDQFRSFVRKHWKLPAALGFLGLVYIIHLDIGAIR
ncbi:MAG: acyltransferase, partial [Firmicutes bacterium]|nr:acyltransferase [Bacillota bacterium]